MLDIDTKRCNGCNHLEEGPQCVSVCPGDLLYMGEDNKITMFAPDECWDCMACVKACPCRALEFQLPYRINESLSALNGRVGTTETIWDIRSTEGELVRRFKVPSKTTETEAL
ncbi:MAG: 4Fe-4S dicluster domain-containing protein [bacterium]|nr:4Fe-4S dicluster domain-containing protein [bacterium]